MNSKKLLLTGGALIACLLGVGEVATSAAQSANGVANSANSGSNQTSNRNSQANGQGNQRDTTPGNNGLAKGHDKQLADLMQEFDACFSAGEAGDVSGYNNAARLLMAGDKDFTNLDSAMAILDKAIKLGGAEAKYLKGALLISQERDVAVGLNYVMEAAQANYPDAQLLLARLYKEGKYLPEDNQIAVEWAKYAADLGLPSANVDFALATLDKTAETNEDDATALKRLVDAADQNDGRAAFKISAMYLSGEQQTADDCDAARKYAQIAYDNGLPGGAFLMATAYLRDDFDAALEWLEKGCSRNDWKSLYAQRLITNGGMSVAEAIGIATKATRKTAMNYKLSMSSGASGTPPVVLLHVSPTIPASLQGVDFLVRIKLRLTVDEEGIPTDIQIVEPSEYEALNAAAAEAIAQWRFRPAMKNGRPVSANVNIPVRFQSAR